MAFGPRAVHNPLAENRAGCELAHDQHQGERMNPNDQTQPASSPTIGAPPLDVIMQRAKQAFAAASGPLSTKEVMNRPWFRENVQDPRAAGRAFSALVRAHAIHKVRQGVYLKGAGPTSATGTPASSSRQARSGNGSLTQGTRRTQGTMAMPKAGTPKAATTKRTTTTGQRANQRQMSGKQQYAQQGRSTTTTTTQQGALWQRIQALETLVSKMSRDLYGR